MSLSRALSIKTRDYAARAEAVNSAENAHVLRVNFETNQAVYIPSQPGLKLPAGAVESDARIATNGISSITDNAGVQTNIATISGCTVTLADVGHDLSGRFAEKLQTQVGTRHKEIEIFALHPDDEFDEDLHLIYTFILENYDNSKDGKRKILYLKDVAREMTATIFDRKEWTVLDSVGRQDSAITISAGPDDDFRFQRGPNDSLYPNENIGFMRFGDDGEIWSYSDRTIIAEGQYSYIVKDRGCFGSARDSFTIADSTSTENRPKVSEFIYYKEDVRDALLMATTGILGDGRRPPAHWTPSVEKVNTLSISSAPFDRQIEIEEPSQQEAKTFYEKYILPVMDNAVMRVEANGDLALQAVGNPVPDAGTSIVFDKTNIDLSSLSPMKVKQDGLAYPISILWDYNPVSQEFANITVSPESLSEQIHGKAKPLEIEMPGYHTGTHTVTELRQKFVSLAERYSHPTTTISFDALTSMRWVSTGTIVRLTIDDEIVIDDTTGNAQSLDRTFLVIGRRYNPSTRKIRYFLWGTSGKAVQREDSILSQHIPDSEYKRGAENLTDHLTIVDGVASGEQSIAPGKYYYEGDLRLSPTFHCTFTGRAGKFQICVMGSLLIQSPNPFELLGMGWHQGGRGRQGLGAGSFGVGGPAYGGSAGYFGRSVGGGGFYLTVRFESGLQVQENVPLWTRKDYRVKSTPGIIGPPPAVQSVPVFALALNDDQFTGIPADLSGSGGAGGQGITKYDAGKYGKAARQNNEQLVGGANTPAVPTTEHVMDGGDGAYGGMGIEIWSRGGGFDGAGALDTSGGDAIDARFDNYVNLLAPQQGRSQPGVAIWIMDDPRADLPDMSATRIKAFTGRINIDGDIATRAPLDDFIWSITGAGKPSTYSYHAPPPRTNLASTAARAQYSPAPEKVQRAVRQSQIEKFFSSQLDNKAKLWIGDVDPSDGSADDILIRQEDLDDTANKQPPIRVFKATDWRDYSWNTDEHSVFYAGLIAFNREYKTSEWTSGPARPLKYSDGDAWTNTLTGETWILRKNGSDELAKVGDTSVGNNHYTDGNFSAQQSANARGTAGPWNIDRAIRTPRLIDTQKDIVTLSGESAAQPPRSVQTFVYDASIEVIISAPSDESEVAAYRVYRDGVRIGPDLIIPTRSYLDTAVVVGNQYLYSVSAVDANGIETPRTDGVAVSTSTNSGIGGGTSGGGGGGTSGGGAPTNSDLPDVTGLRVQIYGDDSGELQWSPPSATVDVTGYEITRDDSATIVTLAGATTNSYYFTDMTASTTYTWTVKVVSSSNFASVGRTVTGTSKA